MKATLLKVDKKSSNQGGFFYYAFFKGEDGKSYRTCLYPKYGNFKRWQGIIDHIGAIIDGLSARGSLIDADSFPKIIEG